MAAHNFGAAFAWIFPFGLVVGLIGMPDTWDRAGRDGLIAELVAGLLVLAEMLVSAIVIKNSSKKGPAAAASAFVIGVPLRVGSTVLLSIAAVVVLKLPPAVFLLWIAIFYVAMLIGQSIWLTRKS